jgi:hypothetical protein
MTKVEISPFRRRWSVYLFCSHGESSPHLFRDRLTSRCPVGLQVIIHLRVRRYSVLRDVRATSVYDFLLPQLN